MYKDTTFLSFSITCGEKLLSFTSPVVMGILNATPDSFYDGGRYTDGSSILRRAKQIVDEGADIIDIGVVSSRPGAQLLSPADEAERLEPVVRLVRSHYPDALISVDTCFSLPARRAVEAGADIVNDISGGQFDPDMFATVADLRVPYILMHTQGRPDHMQDNPHYDNVLQEVCYYLSERLETLYRLGVKDVMIDPGFGFGKSMDDNYRLFSQLPEMHRLFPHNPLLVGVSRKSMIYKLLNAKPDEVLAGTVALQMQALAFGAQILRVHDVKETVQTIQIYNKLWHS